MFRVFKIMKNLIIRRIRKTKTSKITGQKIVAPGVGKKLALHFDPEGGGLRNTITSQKPTKALTKNDVVLNYGNSRDAAWQPDFLKRGGKIINLPENVRNSVDKRRTLGILHEANVPCLEFTEDKNRAMDWLNKGEKVIVRHTVTGKQGAGVELIEPGKALPDAPLYTKFYDKDVEFRVHVLNGKVIDYVQKKKLGKKKQEERGIKVDMITRNHKRGWVFCHNDIIEDDKVKAIAVDATKAIGLDLCAVDILAKVKGNRVVSAIVCECNSSPGMSSSTTFKRYVGAIEKEYLQ